MRTMAWPRAPGHRLPRYLLVFPGPNRLASGIYFLYDPPVHRWMRTRLVSYIGKTPSIILPAVERSDSSPAA